MKLENQHTSVTFWRRFSKLTTLLIRTLFFNFSGHLFWFDKKKKVLLQVKRNVLPGVFQLSMLLKIRLRTHLLYIWTQFISFTELSLKLPSFFVFSNISAAIILNSSTEFKICYFTCSINWLFPFNYFRGIC